ncbi:hypothetical protein LIER_39516 [Lithospermum erythrorhizon]|uniref:Uncharacterized protein n=1 Tax=Lithospermum erythrorhizon TaxID=34254 RepID=A0AAV3QHD5_LITER
MVTSLDQRKSGGLLQISGTDQEQLHAKKKLLIDLQLRSPSPANSREDEASPAQTSSFFEQLRRPLVRTYVKQATNSRFRRPPAAPGTDLELRQPPLNSTNELNYF